MARASLKQRGSLQIWFDPETVWLAEPSGKRGRPASFTDAAIQACLTLKALSGLPIRQTTGLVESLSKLAGLDWSVPDFSTLSGSVRGRGGLIHRADGVTKVAIEDVGLWWSCELQPRTEENPDGRDQYDADRHAAKA